MARNPMLALYQGKQADMYWSESRELPTRVVQRIACLRAEKLQPHISAEMRVLEYGVGNGYNLIALSCGAKIGYDVWGLFRNNLMRSGIIFCRVTSSLPKESFDVVICHHALEHMVNPWTSLGEMKRLLRTGGKLLLFVPYERERRYRHYEPNEKNHHVFSWNPQTLGAFVTGSGFKIKSLRLRRFAYDRFAAVATEYVGFGDRFYRIFRKTLLLVRPEYEIEAILTK